MKDTIDMVTFLSNQKLDKSDVLPSTARYSDGTLRQIKDLNDTIDVQRKIIAEQAVKIRELQAKLKKYGWNL